ncbi:MAG: hypothetical protein ACJ8G3_00085 [Burkholderiaceae bacterium]
MKPMDFFVWQGLGREFGQHAARLHSGTGLQAGARAASAGGVNSRAIHDECNAARRKNTRFHGTLWVGIGINRLQRAPAGRQVLLHRRPACCPNPVPSLFQAKKSIAFIWHWLNCDWQEGSGTECWEKNFHVALNSPYAPPLLSWQAWPQGAAEKLKKFSCGP